MLNTVVVLGLPTDDFDPSADDSTTLLEPLSSKICTQYRVSCYTSLKKRPAWSPLIFELLHGKSTD